MIASFCVFQIRRWLSPSSVLFMKSDRGVGRAIKSSYFELLAACGFISYERLAQLGFCLAMLARKFPAALEMFVEFELLSE